MIKIENTEVFNFRGALRGMRNPLNSWDKSDSDTCGKVNISCDDCYFTEECGKLTAIPYIIGPNDMNLAKRLIKAGTDHRKFLRQIFVSVDITAPLYWWKEADTYKVATVSNSCSTMHTIHKKEFTLDDFSVDHLNCESLHLMDGLIKCLNVYRQEFIETKDKRYWWQMIQLLPTSYNQKRTVTLNYETLRNIYKSRKGHKLDEWSVGFISWIESLPYAKDLIIEE